MPINQNQAGHT